MLGTPLYSGRASEVASGDLGHCQKNYRRQKGPPQFGLLAKGGATSRSNGPPTPPKCMRAFYMNTCRPGGCRTPCCCGEAMAPGLVGLLLPNFGWWQAVLAMDLPWTSFSCSGLVEHIPKVKLCQESLQEKLFSRSETDLSETGETRKFEPCKPWVCLLLQGQGREEPLAYGASCCLFHCAAVVPAAAVMFFLGQGPGLQEVSSWSVSRLRDDIAATLVVSKFSIVFLFAASCCWGEHMGRPARGQSTLSTK